MNNVCSIFLNFILALTHVFDIPSELCAHGISCELPELELTIPQAIHMSYEARMYLHVLHALIVV